ncbi:MAG: hypothetical protein K2L00_03545 [Muribaculaceae bacterium]|nr:hypothetical protein [Muribaculaceae bacterium]
MATKGCQPKVVSAIGNMLDCFPNEDISGYVYMVPNWAHRWFRHKGYVSAMVHLVNLY